MAQSFFQETVLSLRPNYGYVFLDGAANYQIIWAPGHREKGVTQAKSTRGIPGILRCRLKESQALFLGDPCLSGSHAPSHVEETDSERSRDKTQRVLVA